LVKQLGIGINADQLYEELYKIRKYIPEFSISIVMMKRAGVLHSWEKNGERFAIEPTLNY